MTDTTGMNGISDAIFTDKPVLRPGTDWHNGILYMTFPITRVEQVEVGRGKAKHIEEQEITRTLVVSSQGDRFWYDRTTVAEHGFRWPINAFAQKQTNRWPTEDLKAFIDGDHSSGDTTTLFNDLRDIYTSYVEYSDPTFYNLMPYYVMASYVYRLFPSIGYLHFNGTANSGKSQNLKLLKMLAFNCMWASNITTAALYRSVDGWPGLVCLDEAESFDTERGEELRRLLNAGYKDGEPAVRMENDNERKWNVHEYDVFSPKAIASINPLEPVIQSRCIVVAMQPASIKDIKEFRESDQRWGLMRARLYRWAMANAPEIDNLYTQWQQDLRQTDAKALTSRTWEITQCFVILAHHINGIEAARDVAKFFASHFTEQQKSAEEVDRQRLVLKCLPEVLREKTLHPNGYLLKDIHDVVLQFIDEDAREYYHSKHVSKNLTALGFRKRGKMKGGTTVPLNEQEIRDQFAKRGVAPFPADERWLNGDLTYAEAHVAEPPVEPVSIWGASDGTAG